jgi:4-oxalomesaconate tautomerase
MWFTKLLAFWPVSVATACILPESITKNIAHYPENSTFFSIEHPSGEFTVNLEYSTNNQDVVIKSSGVIRTARLISKGDLYISI